MMALTGQQHQAQAQDSLSTAMERLSSSLRVNGAKDDAAGQAIGNRMSSQITGQAMAQRNANDGISMSQTAEGALDQINNNLQRIRELTVQGLNGSLRTSDQDAVQAEINQNLKEINRLAESVGYNGIPLLDGRAGKVDLQVGANDGETLGIDLSPPGFSVEALGLEDFNVAGVPGTATERDTLVGKAEDIVLADARTTVNYPPGAEQTLYTLDEVDEPGNYYVSTGSGNFSRVDVQATHETATDESVVTVSNPQALYQTHSALDETAITNLAPGQRLLNVEDTFYIEEEVDDRVTYREAGFSVSFDESSAATAEIEPDANALDGSGYYTGVAPGDTITIERGGNTVSYQQDEYDTVNFPDVASPDSPELVMGTDLDGNDHYYVKNGSGSDIDYHQVDDIQDRLRVSSSALASDPSQVDQTVTQVNAFEFGGETYDIDDFDNISFEDTTSPTIVKYEDDNDSSVEYFLRTGASGSYQYHDITNVQTELDIGHAGDTFAGPDLLTLSQGGIIDEGPGDLGITQSPEVSDFLQAGVTANFPNDLDVSDPELVQRSGDQGWVIRGTLSGGGYGYYDAELEVELDANGKPTAYTTTTDQASPTVLGVDEHVVEKVHGVSTVTIDPRNVSVEYTDAEGRVYENVLQENEDGNYYFELPGESSLLGGYKSATLVDHDGEGEILLKTKNGSGEVVVYYPTELDQSRNDKFFVFTDGDGFNDQGDPQTRLRIQEAGEDFRFQVPRNPLAALDRAIGMVDAKRSHLGAMEGRLESVITGNETTNINLSAARSRIMDADYADEVSRMTKTQILQQAGTSMLAQANQLPLNALSLLG
ncbi:MULTISPECIES: flagellin [Halomonadaceae]|uniref:flagellin N-terminal helical domain-containing protein n=1 Tax=Halomonadaceae TaxID=28256 RepID=UPI0030EC9F4C